MQRLLAASQKLSKPPRKVGFVCALSFVSVGTESPSEQHEPEILPILTALKSCTTSRRLVQGRILHHHIVTCQILDVSVNNALITMYGKCGSLNEALNAFYHMAVQTVISWNALIAVFILHANYEEALCYFKKMQEESMQPDMITCISAASACAYQNGLEEGLDVHKLATLYGFDTIVEFQNALMHMYGRCRCLDASLSIFKASLQDDIISWNAMITACSYNGLNSLVQELYQQMLLKAMVPNRVSYITIISVLSNMGGFLDGRRIHAVLAGTILEFETVLGTTLISLYGKGGSLRDAHKVFTRLSSPNIVSWNALTAVYVHNKESKIAWQMFYQMQQENNIWNEHTYASIVDSCESKSGCNAGKRLHVLVNANNLGKEIAVGNALINMYGKYGSISRSLELFDQLPYPSQLSWNIMITILARNDNGMRAFGLFNQMLEESNLPDKVTFVGILDACGNRQELVNGLVTHALLSGSHLLLDSVLGNALLNMYSKCGQMPIALRIFDSLHEQDVIAWTALVSGYAQQGQNEEALLTFYHLCQEAVMPNKITCVSALAACSGLVLLMAGKRIHAIFTGCELAIDIFIGNALLNLYGKCGCLRDALMIFEGMLERDTVSWSAMISACAQQGKDDEVLLLFNQMQQAGVRPNSVTFLSVLSAWGHTGKVEEGYYWFLLMDQKFSISPVEDHYNCMIDISGRAGRLDEAEALLAYGTSQISIISVMALLSACKFQADVERGERFARHSFTFFPENAEPYVMLANIYFSVGRVNDAQRVLSEMKKEGSESSPFY